MQSDSPISFIFSRRSIRKYQPVEIPKNEITIILKAAMQAPSAVNKQPWHFIVIKDRQKLSEITKIHRNASFAAQVSHAILICGDEYLEHDKGYTILDCSAATQNILLAANGLGIGACWVGIHPREQRKEAFRELFGLPDHIIPVSMVTLGYPAEEKEMTNRYRSDRVHYNSWNNISEQ